MTDWTDRTLLYKPPSKSPHIVNVPPMRFLMIDSTGLDGADAALITLAHHVRFAARRAGLAFTVGPLEVVFVGAASTAQPPQDASSLRQLMIGLPDEIDRNLVEAVRDRTAVKKGLPLINDVRVQTFSEGEAVQILALGTPAQATTDMLKRFAAEKKREFSGPRHEIHINDPARTAPERLKTIVRYPVRYVGWR